MDSPNQNILTHIEQSNKFIIDALSENADGLLKNKVLIHCFAGKSRATSFLLAYLIKERKISLKDGLDLIWKVRPIAAPNPGFMIQLKAFEKNVLGSTSECEVMQGQWKEKLDALKKEKQEKTEAGEIVSPLRVPEDSQMISNAEKQLGLGLAPKRCEVEDDALESDQKQIQDGLQQLHLKEEEKK